MPYIANNEERLAALKSYNILDTAEEVDFDELTTLASAICQTPVALISLVDEKRQWFKSHTGTPITETPIEYAFCTHAIASFEDIMIVEDAKTDERFADNPLVTGETNITFYAGVPLVTNSGHALGSLCVLDHEQKQLNNQQIEALKILAKQVVNKLELRKKAIDLEKANQELLDSNVFIQKFASMAAHDIKNPLSSILLTSQALKVRMQKMQDEGCLRLVDLNITSTNRLMSLLDEMLAYSQSPSTLLSKKTNLSLTDFLIKVIGTVQVPDNFEIMLPEGNHIVNVSAVALEQIFINLLSNAIRYNDQEKGLIQIRFANDVDYYRFEVQDNGIGIEDQYHEKIFVNNFTLEITDRYNQKGSGIGLSTVKELVKALQGMIYIKSIPGKGTTFFIAIRK